MPAKIACQYFVAQVFYYELGVLTSDQVEQMYMNTALIMIIVAL